MLKLFLNFRSLLKKPSIRIIITGKSVEDLNEIKKLAKEDFNTIIYNSLRLYKSYWTEVVKKRQQVFIGKDKENILKINWEF